MCRNDGLHLIKVLAVFFVPNTRYRDILKYANPVRGVCRFFRIQINADPEIEAESPEPF